MENVKILTIENLGYFKTKQDAFNDSKFATKASVPTRVSQLENDSIFQTKTEVDTAISSAVNTAIASVMTYKGIKATISELPGEDNKVGDVWHVTENASEYAWDGTKWEALGSTVELTWDAITGKPSTFTPAAHTHVTADIIDLTNATTSVAGLMSAADKTKLDAVQEGANNYTHPTSPAGAKAAGLYKIATDANGHVSGATAVAKSDIDALGVISVPAGGTDGQYLQKTAEGHTWAAVPTYSEATQKQAGLMSAADKTKLDSYVVAEETDIDGLF